VPEDIVPAIRKLMEERKKVSVSEDNLFLFPYTQSSQDHVPGWSAVQDVQVRL